MVYVAVFAAGLAAGVILDVVYSKRVVAYFQGLEKSLKAYIDAKL
jgi:hypothetical protein